MTSPADPSDSMPGPSSLVGKSADRSDTSSEGKPMPAGDSLPPVQPPSTAFLLQLFLIPMIIVSIIVAVWVTFSWLVHMGSDPHELVRDLQTLNEASWQKAYTLSNMLRNPQYESLKEDPELAAELAEVLASELESSKHDQSRIQLRVFLCRALGEFHVSNGLDELLDAATTERDPAERHVRLAALEAIAVRASQAPSDAPLRGDSRVMEAMIEATRVQDAGKLPEGTPTAASIRSTAAFALGVIGGDEALNQLAMLCDDPASNARFNAATGLARHGDERAEPGLLEMLNPNATEYMEEETTESERQFKRELVLTNGLKAAGEYASKSKGRDTSRLRDAIAHLQDADVPRAVRNLATETLDTLPP